MYWLRLDIDLTTFQRFATRRVQAVHEALVVIKGLVPQRFGPCVPALPVLASVLGVSDVLVVPRGIAELWLKALPRQLGFCPRAAAVGGRYLHTSWRHDRQLAQILNAIALLARETDVDRIALQPLDGLI